MTTGKYIITSKQSQDYYSKRHIFQTFDDGVTFETCSFYRHEMNRYDLCISSSAGCSLGCSLCQCTYAHAGYERNLSANEMNDQIEFVFEDGRNFINEKTIVLVVFMGNGDPFHNLAEVIEAIKLAHYKYSNLITRFGVSTIGVNIKSVKLLADLSLRENIEVRLQFSTVSIDDAVRKKMLPKSKPLSEAEPYLDWYASVTGTQVRYNFPMIEGINDSSKHLDGIARFIMEKPQLRIVKLSSYNEISEKIYRPCSDAVITKSAEYLRDKGVKVDIFFANRDKQVCASCGQLRAFSTHIINKAPSKECDSSPKLVLFSHNQDKKILAQAVGNRFNIDISLMEELSASFVDNVEQDGITYLDRALLKAKEGYELTNRPCIATDYGMEILSLNRKPGAQTEHWMNSMTDDELLRETIKLVSEMSPSERSCEFVGVGVIVIDECKYLYVRDSDRGILLTSPIGPIRKGHPLSSLLYIPEEKKTLAQLTADEYLSKDIRIYNKLLGDFNSIISNGLRGAGRTHIIIVNGRKELT